MNLNVHLSISEASPFAQVLKPEYLTNYHKRTSFIFISELVVQAKKV